MLDSFLTSFATDLGKQLLYAVPRSVDKWRFRRFFGPHATSGKDIFAVVDPYSHPTPRIGNRFVKRFHGRKPDQPLIGEDNVLGTNVIRVATYVVAAFSQFRPGTDPVSVVIDEQIHQRWDGTFICFGSADSNLKTFDIEQLPEQSFYTFTFDPSTGHRSFEIGGRHYSVGRRTDHAILLRTRNPRHPEHYLFVCAGHSEWGTSGAAYYLFHKWKDLYKKHKKKDFCKVLEVDAGSDESAREILSLSS